MDKTYVKCIDAGLGIGITLGKIYEVTGTCSNFISIINDNKKRESYFAYRFEEVEHNVEIGDTVKITKAGCLEKDDWYPRLNTTIGEIHKVVKIGPPNAPKFKHLVQLENEFWYNPETLEIVKKGNDMENTAKNTMIKSVQNREFIVGSVNEHGYVSISASPVRHSTEAQAKAEAKRLAGLDSSKTFIVLQFRAGFQATQVVEI